MPPFLPNSLYYLHFIVYILLPTFYCLRRLVVATAAHVALQHVIRISNLDELLRVASLIRMALED